MGVESLSISAGVLIAGTFSEESLEWSYARAFAKLGLTVARWDMPPALRRHARLGRLGAYLNQFWPSEPWIAKANAELLTLVMDTKPDLVVVFTSCRVSAGTLAQIKTSLPGCELVLVWPDPLLNCHSLTIAAIPVYDLIATFSKASIPAFLRLGARRAEWVPLGFDPDFHSPGSGPTRDPRFAGDYDVCFVGNFSAERERVILRLFESGVRVAVWGAPSSWHAAGNRSAASRYFKGGPLFAKDLSAAMRAAPLSLNWIARSTYPAANMRFFEILGSGGVSLSSPCPEFAEEFPDGETCIYYQSHSDVVDVAQRALANRSNLEHIAQAGQARVLSAHTYMHRARRVLHLLRNI